MLEKKFEVLVDNEVVARDMNMETAMILVKALFEKYCNEHFMVVSIKEMDRCIDTESCERSE